MIRIDKRVRSLEEISKNLLGNKNVNSLQDEQMLSHHIEISITDILTVKEFNDPINIANVHLRI
jgi:hypothetical protein